MIRELGGGVAGSRLAGGRISDEVLCLGERLGAGLIVLGSRGLGMVARARTATRVVRVAPCPVLVYAPSDEERSE